MEKWKDAFGRLAQRFIDRFMGNGLMQEETEAAGEKYVTRGIGALIRQAGAEGCVLRLACRLNSAAKAEKGEGAQG